MFLAAAAVVAVVGTGAALGLHGGPTTAEPWKATDLPSRAVAAATRTSVAAYAAGSTVYVEGSDHNRPIDILPRSTTPRSGVLVRHDRTTAHRRLQPDELLLVAPTAA